MSASVDMERDAADFTIAAVPCAACGHLLQHHAIEGQTLGRCFVEAGAPPDGVVLLVGPPLPTDDPAEVRYSVARRGRVVMAGTAPSAAEARRLALGEGVG